MSTTEMMKTNDGMKIFKPRSSNGWIWVTALGLLLLGAGVAYLVTAPVAKMGPLGYLLPVLTGALAIVSLLLAVFFPAMRYEIGNERLIVRYGPLLRYEIFLDSIERIERRNLQVPVTSSFRFPGLAVFTVPYPEVGKVKMCARAVSDRILLIETTRGKYGVTPADEDAFVAELRGGMEH